MPHRIVSLRLSMLSVPGAVGVVSMDSKGTEPEEAKEVEIKARLVVKKGNEIVNENETILDGSSKIKIRRIDCPMYGDDSLDDWRLSTSIVFLQARCFAFSDWGANC